MIKVNRATVPAPNVLTRSDERGPRETAAAIAFFAKQKASGNAHPKDGDSFDGFKVYSEPEVRWLLDRLFHGKCAYCESRYRGTQPMDVEHWRPKGAVSDDDAKDHPGYYWLAAQWTNLLPSCIDCNRARTQRVGSEDGIPRAKTLGKANKFPLAPNSKRAFGPEELHLERPLLLDPCNSDLDPEDHLRFRTDGMVLPKCIEIESGELSPRAIASIEVFGLNRFGLVCERRERVIQIQQRMYSISELSYQLNACHDSRNRDLIEDVLSQEIFILASMCASDAPFSGLARQLVVPFMNELIGDFTA